MFGIPTILRLQVSKSKKLDLCQNIISDLHTGLNSILLFQKDIQVGRINNRTRLSFVPVLVGILQLRPKITDLTMFQAIQELT